MQKSKVLSIIQQYLAYRRCLITIEWMNGHNLAFWRHQCAYLEEEVRANGKLRNYCKELPICQKRNSLLLLFFLFSFVASVFAPHQPNHQWNKNKITISGQTKGPVFRIITSKNELQSLSTKNTYPEVPVKWGDGLSVKNLISSQMPN